MKKLNLLLLLSGFIFLFNACNNLTKCDGIACVAAPPIPVFKLISPSGTNISDSTAYYLKIASDSTRYRGKVVTNPEKNLYWDIIFTKGQQGVKEFELYADDTKLGVLRYEISLKTSGCCSNYSIDILNFNGSTLLNSQNQYGVFQLKLK